MTGLECLKEEMKARGLNQAQCDSKVAAVVLDILSNSDTNHTEEYQIRADLNKLRKECEKEEFWLQELREQHSSLFREMNELRIKQKKWQDEVQKNVDEILNQLKECETAEGRDRIKLAQMFVNSVDVNTKYDNTAYIIGLSAILSNGKVAPVEELKKINTKMPGLDAWRKL